MRQAQSAYDEVKNFPDAGASPQAVQLEQNTIALEVAQAQLALTQKGADEALTAAALGVPVLLTGQIFNLYRTLQQMGLGEEGNHALVKALENLSGVQIA